MGLPLLTKICWDPIPLNSDKHESNHNSKNRNGTTNNSNFGSDNSNSTDNNFLSQMASTGRTLTVALGAAGGNQENRECSGANKYKLPTGTLFPFVLWGLPI